MELLVALSIGNHKTELVRELGKMTHVTQIDVCVLMRVPVRMRVSVADLTPPGKYCVPLVPARFYLACVFSPSCRILLVRSLAFVKIDCSALPDIIVNF